MPPRFDDEALVLELSVADLIERDAGRRIGFVQRSGYERLWVGQAIHSRYQERAMVRDRSYQREVHLALELEHRGWTVRLRGRVDGIRKDPDGISCLEEIKSIRPDGAPAPATMEGYLRQLRLYAWMSFRLNQEPVRAELVLIQIGASGDDGIERRTVEIDQTVIEAGVRRRLNALLREHENRREARERRRLGAQALEFPFHLPRPGQEQIMEAVEVALEQKEHLLVEAATGLGKTVACLFPVMRFALENDKRVFVLTAKTLQQTMANQVLDLVNRDRTFHSLQLRAKSRMCANDEVLCHEEYCPYAKDYFAKLTRTQLLPRLLEQHQSLLPDDIFDAARSESVCPFEVSLELGAQVQAVVCDYNYAFDPYVQLHEFGPENDLSGVILVIDEIHNLIDRGRGYYSPSLSAGRAREVAEAITALSHSSFGVALRQRLVELCSELASLIEQAVYEVLPNQPQPMATEGEFPEEELWDLRPQLDRAFIEYLEHRRETRSFAAEDPFVGLYFEVLRFVNTLVLSSESRDDAFSHVLQVDNGDASLRILCKDASRFLGRLINRTHSTVALSATLSPPEFYRDLLGFDSERTADLKIDNPFPGINKRVVVDATVATTFKQRESNYLPIAERLQEFADAIPGNCLALFPSYRFLSEVAERLPGGGSKRVLIQRRAGSGREREEILETLRSALFGENLLLAVAGGVFAEGVDYPGDMLQGVAVVGPCLPAVSHEQKLLENYYDQRFDRGFEYAFVIPGMTRVVQAAGRLIRSAQDRGVIALFDRRFLAQPYRRHMPNDWLENDSDKPTVGHPATVAASFFRDTAESMQTDSSGQP